MQLSEIVAEIEKEARLPALAKRLDRLEKAGRPK